jgi:glucose-6-phosphate isomerase
MKSWCLPHFVIDLSALWSHPEGPRISGAEGGESERVWHKFQKKCESAAVGFFDFPADISDDTVSSWEALARNLRNTFEGALLIGIGGSHLGAEALLQACRSQDDEKKFHLSWVTQPDPEVIRRAVSAARDRKLATVVISKSGNTTETLSTFYHLSRHTDPKGYVVITDPVDGELRALVKRYGWRSLDVPSNIGGRFSVLTAVGLFPALLGNIPAREVLQGARAFRDAITRMPREECPAFWLALSHKLWVDVSKRPIHYLIPYRSSLQAFAQWYVQLWAESLGKKLPGNLQTHAGFTPVAALGSTDQHSVLQLFSDGPRDKILGFLDVVEHSRTLIGNPIFECGAHEYLVRHAFEELSHLSCVATEKSLRKSQVPTYRIAIEKIDPGALGSLFLFFETACALCGELYGINAFDQPGVEESKRLLKELLTPAL